MLYLGINYGNLPVIEHFQKKHKPEQLIVVTDAGLLSNKNIQILIDKNYQYIFGARIKDESKCRDYALKLFVFST